MDKVLIGIQARSTSERLPGKVFMDVGGKPLLQHVIDACESAARYINRHKRKNQVEVGVALVIPYGDKIKDHFKGIQIFEGPEDDVLERYYIASLKYKPDYMVRITGDCPLIPPFIIAKCINTIVMNDLDYVSNVDENTRLSQDGVDCEAFKVELLNNARFIAEEKSDREHVTTWMRRQEIIMGHIEPEVPNVFAPKISVDTEEDLERVRKLFDLKEKATQVEGLNGKRSFYRF